MQRDDERPEMAVRIIKRNNVDSGIKCNLETLNSERLQVDNVMERRYAFGSHFWAGGMVQSLRSCLVSMKAWLSLRTHGKKAGCAGVHLYSQHYGGIGQWTLPHQWAPSQWEAVSKSKVDGSWGCPITTCMYIHMHLHTYTHTRTQTTIRKIWF